MYPGVYEYHYSGLVPTIEDPMRGSSYLKPLSEVRGCSPQLSVSNFADLASGADDSEATTADPVSAPVGADQSLPSWNALWLFPLSSSFSAYFQSLMHTRM